MLLNGFSVPEEETSPAVGDGGESTAALRALAETVAATVRTGAWPPRRVSVRLGNATLEVEWPASAPLTPPVTSPPLLDERYHRVNSPLVGTLYRSPQPKAPPFVEAGDRVEAGTQVAIVEAMKLLHPVYCQQSGRVSDILVNDAVAVEYDQTLLIVELDDR
jgi:acetyl-CoA carboxylase biotin carboxyl carrier protein